MLLKGFGQLGVLPESAISFGIDLMPVDIAAKEVVLLTKGMENTYHIMILMQNKKTKGNITCEYRINQ